MPATMQVQPYLFFEGRCEEALEFYRDTLGAEVTALMRGKDSPDPGMVPPGGENKIIHARIRIGEAMLMASDGRCGGGPPSRASRYRSPRRVRPRRVLSEGGQVHMPLTRTFFSPCFGMVADRFGVSWMIHVTTGAAARGEELARRFEAKAQDAATW
jgi:PhnB protein